MLKLNKKTILIAVLLVVMLVLAIWKIVGINKESNKTTQLQDETIDQYVLPSVDEEPEPTEQPVLPTVEETPEPVEDDPDAWYRQINVDIEGLQSVNPDVIGWIYFENEESISYPILYSGDNEKYLYRAYTGEEIKSGSIFMEGINSPDLTDAHTLIYGHNMRDLSMFGKLKLFRKEQDYYDTHRYFQIITKEDVYRYQIFAYEINKQVTGGVYCVYREPLDDFYEFLDETIIERSLVSCDIDVRDYDHVVTLSTCASGSGENKFSVSAVRVDEHSRVPEPPKEEDNLPVEEPVPEPPQEIEEEPVVENRIETYITTSKLTLRKEAGKNSEKILYIPQGETVEYQDEFVIIDEIKWLKVKYQEQVGYCSSQFLKLEESSGDNEKQALIANDKLSLRESAGKSSARMLVIPKGAVVQYLDEFVIVDEVKWLKVEYQDKVGYCSAEYLDDSISTPER